MNLCISTLWVLCIFNVLTVLLCISNLKSSQSLPMQIQSLVYAVSKVKFSFPPFLNPLICYISCLPALHLTLRSSGTAFISITLHLLSHLWLLMWTTPSSMVVVPIHSECMVHCITKWVLCIHEMVDSLPMHSSTSMMTRLLSLPATTVIQIGRASCRER